MLLFLTGFLAGAVCTLAGVMLPKLPDDLQQNDRQA